MFRMNLSNELARHLHNFGFTRTAAALNKGTQERSVDYGAVVRGPAVPIHPVPVRSAQIKVIISA